MIHFFNISLSRPDRARAIEFLGNAKSFPFCWTCFSIKEVLPVFSKFTHHGHVEFMFHLFIF